jgi:hypothetical protein
MIGVTRNKLSKDDLPVVSFFLHAFVPKFVERRAGLQKEKTWQNLKNCNPVNILYLKITQHAKK